MMKVISLLLLALCLLSLRCSTKQKQFRDFDPLKKALADNKVLAYISYAMDKGKLLKGDTIVVDSKGNEIIRDGFGFMTPTVTKKFDRLDRPVSVFWKSDISWFEKFEYESPSQYVLIRNEFVGGYPTDTCRLLSRTITEFDPETGLPLKQEQIGNLNNSNTEKYEFEYYEDRIVCEKLVSEEFTDYTEYNYDEGYLVSKTRNQEKYSTSDYFAKNGLRDSTVSLTDSTVCSGRCISKVYYKYYFRK